MLDVPCRKVIHFDLLKTKLEQMYPNLKPYEKIKNFMLNNGFEHRQYSGYISKEPKTRAQIMKLEEKLYKTFVWLYDGVNKMDVSNVDELYYSMKRTREKTLETAQPEKFSYSVSNCDAFSNEYKNAINKDEIKNIENKYGISAAQFEFLEKERKALQAKAIEQFKANKALENSAKSTDKER